MRQQKASTGFTLLELIITVAILSIVLSFATYAWTSFVERGRARSIVENYHSLFAFARWSAASQRTFVTICPLNSNLECTDSWDQAVHVFTDKNNDKKPDDGKIMRHLAPEHHPFSVRSRTAGRGYFQFNSNGMIHGPTGSLVACPTSNTTGTMMYMAVNKGGRFRVEYDTDRDGEIRLRWGSVIKCT